MMFTYNTMPVEFANGTLPKMLLGAGNIMAGGQILDNLLTHPAALEQPRLGVRKAPLQVGYYSVVGRLLAKIVGVL